MTQILLIRHGQSANNALLEHQRVCDPGLTDLGVKQAQLTARALAESPITHLYCSPFLRSLETVRPLAEARQMPVAIRGDIFENGGCYSGHIPGQLQGELGMSRAQLASQYPSWDLDARIAEPGWWGRPYETEEQATDRARGVLRWLENDLRELAGTHALVIHADFKRMLLSVMFEHCATALMPIIGPLHNVGITRLEISDAGWRLLSLNATTHLPANCVSD